MDPNDYITKCIVAVLGVVVGGICILGIIWLMIAIGAFFKLIPEVP